MRKQPSAPEDLVLGLLAVLAKEGRHTLRTDDRMLHDSFQAALDEFAKEGGNFEKLTKPFNRDIVSNTFHQLDVALIRAGRDGFVSFPNPTYLQFQILLTPQICERILDGWGEKRVVVERAAQKFIEAYQRAAV